jgi:chemotaxis protein CheX
MDVQYINPFITETRNCFKTMLSVELSMGKPVVQSKPVHSYDVSGIIGLSGEAQGVISISYPKRVALMVVSMLLGTEIKIVGEELVDGIGEITNVIAGNVKKHFTQFSLSISLPNVVLGKGHRIEVPSGSPALIVPLSGSLGEMAMEVALKTR